MTNIVDYQYVTMLSSRLQGFVIKHRNPLKVNFRCPRCGDSQKSRVKARGWITENPKTGFMNFKCFNCGSGDSFSNFLKTQDQFLYNEYIAERYMSRIRVKEDALETAVKKAATPTFTDNPLSRLKKMSQLKPDHPIRKYIESRQIPADQQHRLYYAPKFMGWINTILPDKFEKIFKDEPRLVIPFFDKDGKMFGVSARGFNPKDLRYITIMFDDDHRKIFGLDSVDFSKKYYVVEGSLDALFIPNSVAMAGADGNLQGLENIENAVFVFDAEPRNREIVGMMEKLVAKGVNFCIWPETVPGKDINDMILSGMTTSEILNVIDENTFCGLRGQLRLNAWKKTR